MARKAGRFSSLYVSVTSGGSASPLLHTGTFGQSFQTDQIDVTAHGDTNKTSVTGLPGGDITFDGFASDTAGTALVAAALDGQARSWYLYPFENRSIYTFGTGFCSFEIRSDVAGAVQMSGSIVQATAIGNVGF